VRFRDFRSGKVVFSSVAGSCRPATRWRITKSGQEPECGPILNECGPERQPILNQCGPKTADVFGSGHLCFQVATINGCANPAPHGLTRNHLIASWRKALATSRRWNTPSSRNRNSPNFSGYESCDAPPHGRRPIPSAATGQKKGRATRPGPHDTVARARIVSRRQARGQPFRNSGTVLTTVRENPIFPRTDNHPSPA
jgi:hypothetical protein